MSESFSSLNENKRVETLFRLSPTSIASVKCLKLNNGRCFTVFSTGNKLLHVMENHKIYCVIDIGSCILKVLDCVDEKVWVVTNDGKLWAVPIPLQEADEHKSQQANSQAVKANPNHEIFAELLGDDNPSSSSYKHVAPFSNVRKCSDDSVVYWETGLQNVAIGSHHMIVCSSIDQDVKLTVYPWIKQHNAGTREVASNFLNQISLPRNACNHSNNDVTTLLYVSPSEQFSSKCANSALDQQLFSSLFAGQSEGNIPVVLVGFQSGFVAYLPVGVKNNNSNLKTLYHIEQAVVNIFSVCLNSPLPKGVNPNDTLTGNALVILGALGKLVVLTQDKSNGSLDGILIREYHVPGTVVYAAMNLNLSILFYSTLKEIFVVKLGFKTEGKSGDKNANSCPLPSLLSPVTMNIPKVLAFAISNDPDSMICLKTDGRVLLVVKPLTKENSCSQCSTVAASMPSGEKIKKHLEEIHEKSCHVKKLCDEIHQLDDVLKQLNNVTQVLCEILRTQESQNDSIFQESFRAGISFKVEVDYEAQGTSFNPRVILRCSLANATRFPFSSNWSLVVQVGTTQPWFNENCSVQTRKSHSVSLSAASAHHISIPMEDSQTYLTPIQVSCYVCFGLKALLPVFLKDTEPNLAEEGFTVLVSKTELNVLSFLRKQETCSTVTHQSVKHPTCLLQNTLRSLNTTWIPSEAAKLVQDKTFCTFSIRLSKEAVHFIQKRVTNLIENESETSLKQTYKSKQDESKDKFLDPEEIHVLQFILRGSRRHLYCGDMKYLGGHVVARIPSEEVVKFQVVKLDQVGTTGGMEGLEMHVHTSSQALGCAVHSALLKVLKPVLQRSPAEENASIPVVELQKQLIKLKELQMSLDLIRPSVQSEESIEEDRPHEATVQKLISIYCDLRKIPTIMP